MASSFALAFVEAAKVAGSGADWQADDPIRLVISRVEVPAAVAPLGPEFPFNQRMHSLSVIAFAEARRVRTLVLQWRGLTDDLSDLAPEDHTLDHFQQITGGESYIVACAEQIIRFRTDEMLYTLAREQTQRFRERQRLNKEASFAKRYGARSGRR
jgi:hypothetical protein